MKRFSVFILILGALSFSFITGNDCHQSVETINKIYGSYLKGKNYIKFKTYNGLDSLQSTVLVTEVWSEGANIKMKTELYTIYADAKYSVIILHEDRKVIIQNVGKQTNPSQKLNLEELQKHATLSCEKMKNGNQKLKIDYNTNYQSQYSIKACHVTYNSKENRIKKTSYLNWSEEGRWIWKHDENLSRKRSFEANIVSSNCMNKVMKNGKLKSPFENFELIDLRK